MVRMIFNDSEDEADHNARMLRYQSDIDELHDFLTHRKKWLDTCDFCIRRAEEESATSSPHPSLYTRSDDVDVKCTPIVGLLPELLVQIFVFLTEDDPPRVQETWHASYSRTFERPYLGWIRVTHVCRRWRDIAISAAILWTDLCQGAVLGPSWTRTFISRAKSAAVTIKRFDDYPKSLVMLCDYILDHPAHLRHVTLSTEWTPFSVLMEYTSTWSSMLVSADLDGGIGHYLCPPLFGGYAPNLRRLKLSNVHPWRCHSLLGGLIELDVFLCSSFPPDMDSGDPDPILIGVLPGLAQALDVLEEAPLLERLALHYAIPPDDFVRDSPRKVYLNHIQTLSISAKIMDCIPFLKRVVVPPNAILDITCIPGLYPERFHDLFRLFINHIHHPDTKASAISRLEVGTGKFGDKFQLRIYTDLHGAVAQKVRTRSRGVAPQRCDLPAKPFITLSLAYATSLQHIYVLRQFFATMPLHDVSYLAVHGCWHIDSDGWRMIFRDSTIFLQSVRLLVLGQDCAQYFFHAIHDKESSTPDLRPLPFPNLDTIILRNIDFFTFFCALDKVSFQEQMLYDLHGRERRGRKLRVLYFISCQGLDESWVADLREVVRFVVFGF